MELLTASSSAHPTALSACNGPSKTSGVRPRTSSGQTKLVYKWKHTCAFTATRKVRSQDTNLGLTPCQGPRLGRDHWRGATGVCIFEGIMDNPMYTSILEEYLLPFIQDVYPDGHKFMQDNDPKHTSRHLQAFFAENRINWWKTPPESPDANPIENLWHELKACFCSYKTFCALMKGIPAQNF